MAIPSVTQAKSKYQSNVQSSGQRFVDGVNAVQTSPAQQAIAQEQKMITNWNNAITSGKWATNLGAVTLAEWRQATAGDGGLAYTQSAQKGADKWGQWFTDARPVFEAIQQEVRAMPNTTLQDGINRMIFNVTEMANRLG